MTSTIRENETNIDLSFSGGNRSVGAGIDQLALDRSEKRPPKAAFSLSQREIFLHVDRALVDRKRRFLDRLGQGGMGVNGPSQIFG